MGHSTKTRDVIGKEAFERPARMFAQVGAVVFLIGCFVFGGSSRADEPAQVAIRILSIGVIAIALFFIRRVNLLRVSTPLLFLGVTSGLMLLQLIPLPPLVWQQFPGRELAVRGSQLVGLEEVWRPVSLAPDATLNSLLATLPGFAIILLLSLTRTDRLLWVLVTLSVLILIGGIIGLAQVSSDQMYFFDITNHGSAVGVFANRNHQAATLAYLVPMLALFPLYPDNRLPLVIKLSISFALFIFLIPLILITGSRTGILLLIVAITGAVLIARSSNLKFNDTFGHIAMARGATLKIILGALAIGFIALVGALIASGRAVAINRVFEQDVEADARLRLFSVMIDMAEKYFPLGSGFGTFPLMFKIDEPGWYLRAPYFNHAHNDILEILIEGGVLSFGLVIAVLVWWIVMSIRLWSSKASSVYPVLMGRLGSVQTLILALASVVDYPLRTPLGQVLFLVAMVLMARGASAVTRSRPSFAEMGHIRSAAGA